MISSAAITSALEALADCSVQAVRPISGGDINEAFGVDLSDDGHQLFVKANTSPAAREMFKSEAVGLQDMAHLGIRTPQVLFQGSWSSFSFLVLEWIPQGVPANDYWEDLGRCLARMHRVKQPYYGWYLEGFIGTLPQPNRSSDNWTKFFWEHRLSQQFNQAVAQQLFSSETCLRFAQLEKVLGSLFPVESPSLLHGDLWSGNVMIGKEGNAVLIDPASYYGHREMDLAMTRLFGGFPTAFYEAYQAVYPLAGGWEDRIAICQLYYVLVHVNLFGGSYVQHAERIIRQYT